MTCCIQNAHGFPPISKGPAAQRRERWVVVLSVTPQQAAAVLELGACTNYCIISPPTLSLTSGETGEAEQLQTFNTFYCCKNDHYSIFIVI